MANDPKKPDAGSEGADETPATGGGADAGATSSDVDALWVLIRSGSAEDQDSDEEPANTGLAAQDTEVSHMEPEFIDPNLERQPPAPPVTPPSAPPVAPPEEPEPAYTSPVEDIRGYQKMQADRVLQRPKVQNDIRDIVRKLGATRAPTATNPLTARELLGAFTSEMFALFRNDEIYRHPLRRILFLQEARASLDPAAPGYSGMFASLSRLESAVDRRLQVGIKAIGERPDEEYFSFDRSQARDLVQKELLSLVSEEAVRSINGSDGVFNFASFEIDERGSNRDVAETAKQILGSLPKQVSTIAEYGTAMRRMWEIVTSPQTGLQKWNDAEVAILVQHLLKRIDGRSITGQACRAMVRAYLVGSSPQVYGDFLNKTLFQPGGATDAERNPYVFAEKAPDEAKPAYVDVLPARLYHGDIDEERRLIVSGENLSPWLFGNLDFYEGERGRPAFNNMVAVFCERVRILGNEINKTAESMPENQAATRRKDCLQKFLRQIDCGTEFCQKIRRFVISVIGKGESPEVPVLKPTEQVNWQLLNAKGENIKFKTLSSDPPLNLEAGLKLATDLPSPGPEEALGWRNHIEKCTNYLFANTETYEQEGSPQAFKRMLVNFVERLHSLSSAIVPSGWKEDRQKMLIDRILERVDGRTAYGQALRVYVHGFMKTGALPQGVVKIVNEDNKYADPNIDWGIFCAKKDKASYKTPQPYLPPEMAGGIVDIESWLIDNIHIYNLEKDSVANHNMTNLFMQRVTTISRLQHAPENRNLLAEKICEHIHGSSLLGQSLRNWTLAVLQKVRPAQADIEIIEDKNNYLPRKFDAHLIGRKAVISRIHQIPLSHTSLPSSEKLAANELQALEEFIFEGIDAYISEGSAESARAFAEIFVSKVARVREHFIQMDRQSTDIFWTRIRNRLNNDSLFAQVLRRCTIPTATAIADTANHRDLRTAIRFLYELPRGEHALGDLVLSKIEEDDLEFDIDGGTTGPLPKENTQQGFYESYQDIPHYLFAAEIDHKNEVRPLEGNVDKLLGWLFSDLQLYFAPQSDIDENLKGAEALLSKRAKALIESINRQPVGGDWTEEKKAGTLQKITEIIETASAGKDFESFIREKQQTYPHLKVGTVKPVPDTKKAVLTLLKNNSGNQRVAAYLPEFFYKLETIFNEGWLAETPRETAYTLCAGIISRLDAGCPLYPQSVKTITAYFQNRFEFYRANVATLRTQAENDPSNVSEFIVTELSADNVDSLSAEVFESVRKMSLGCAVVEVWDKVLALKEEMERGGYRQGSRATLATACNEKIPGNSPIAECLRRIVSAELTSSVPDKKAENRLISLVTPSGPGNTQELRAAVPTGRIDSQGMDQFLTTLSKLIRTEPAPPLEGVFGLIHDTRLGRQLKMLILTLREAPDTYERKKAELLAEVEEKKPLAEKIFSCVNDSERSPYVEGLFEGIHKGLSAQKDFEFFGDRDDYKVMIRSFGRRVSTLVASEPFKLLSESEKEDFIDSIIKKIQGHTPLAQELRLYVRDVGDGQDINENVARIFKILNADPDSPDDWGVLGDDTLAWGFQFPKAPVDPAMRNSLSFVKMISDFISNLESFGKNIAGKTRKPVEIVRAIQNKIYGAGLYAIELRNTVGEVILGHPRAAMDRISKAEKAMLAQSEAARVDASWVGGATPLSREDRLNVAKPYRDFEHQNIDWNIFGPMEGLGALPMLDSESSLEDIYPDPDAFVERLFHNIDVENDSALKSAVHFFDNLERLLPPNLARPQLTPDKISTHKGSLRVLKQRILKRIDGYLPLALRVRDMVKTYFSYDWKNNDAISREFHLQKGPFIASITGRKDLRATEIFLPTSKIPASVDPPLAPEPTTPSYTPTEMPAGMEPLPTPVEIVGMDPSWRTPSPEDLASDNLPGLVTPRRKRPVLEPLPLPTATNAETLDSMIRTPYDPRPIGLARTEDATPAVRPIPPVAVEAAPENLSIEAILAKVPALFTNLDRANFASFPEMLIEFANRLDRLVGEAKTLPNYETDRSDKDKLILAVTSWIDGETRLGKDFVNRVDSIIYDDPNAAENLRRAIKENRVYTNQENINWNIFRKPLRKVDDLSEEDLTQELESILPDGNAYRMQSGDHRDNYKKMLNEFLDNLEIFANKYDLKNTSPEKKAETISKLRRAIFARNDLAIFFRIYVGKRLSNTTKLDSFRHEVSVERMVGRLGSALDWGFFDPSKISAESLPSPKDTIIEAQALDEDALRQLAQSTVPKVRDYRSFHEQGTMLERVQYIRFIQAFQSAFSSTIGEIPRPVDAEKFRTFVAEKIREPRSSKLGNLLKQYVENHDQKAIRARVKELIGNHLKDNTHECDWHIFDESDLEDIFSRSISSALQSEPDDLPTPPRPPKIETKEKSGEIVEIKILRILSVFDKQAKAAKAWTRFSLDTKPSIEKSLDALLAEVEAAMNSDKFPKEQISNALKAYIKVDSPLGPKFSAILDALVSGSPDYASLKTGLFSEAASHQKTSNAVWDLFKQSP